MSLSDALFEAAEPLRGDDMTHVADPHGVGRALVALMDAVRLLPGRDSPPGAEDGFVRRCEALRTVGALMVAVAAEVDASRRSKA